MNNAATCLPCRPAPRWCARRAAACRRCAARRATEGAAFDAAVAGAPLAGAVQGHQRRAAASDLRCDALAVTGRWPAELRGRFYRNGPAAVRTRRPALPPLVRRRRHGAAVHASPARGVVAPSAAWCARPSSSPSSDAGRFLLPRLRHARSRATRRSRAPIRSTSPTPTRSSTPAACWRCGKAARPSRSTRDDLSTHRRGDLEGRPRAGAVLGPPQGRRRRPPLEHRHLRPTSSSSGTSTRAAALASVQIGESPYPNGMVHDVADHRALHRRCRCRR